MYENKKIINEFVDFKKTEIREDLQIEFNIDPEQFKLDYGTSEISDEMVDQHFNTAKGTEDLQQEQLRQIKETSYNLLKTSR